MELSQCSLLRIFVSENDRSGSRPVFEQIIGDAKKHGLAGVTVIRGLEGYGAASHMHTAKVLRLASNLPIIIEIVDDAAKIDAFLPVLDEIMTEGLVTVENVKARTYKKTPSK